MYKIINYNIKVVKQFILLLNKMIDGNFHKVKLIIKIQLQYKEIN